MLYTGKLSSYMSLDRPKNRIRKREQPTWEDQRHGGQQYRSSTDLTTAVAPPKRRSTASSGGGKLTRSVSDAGNRDKPLASGDGDDAKRSISLFGTIQRIKTKIKKRPTAMAVDRSSEPSAVQVMPPGPSPPPAPVRAKKQLSPIIESSPRDEYFKYSVGGPLDYGGASPPRPVRGHKVDRIVRKLQQQQQQHHHHQQQQQATAAELARHPSPPPPSSSSPDFAHAHNGNEPFSYTATPSPTIVHLPDDTAADRPPPPRRLQRQQQYRSAGSMDDTWTSYDDLSHRRDALESRLQKRAAVVRPQRTGTGTASVRVRTPTEPASPDTYATVYKKNETLGGGDRYFERKIVTEHRFARRTPRLSGDGAGDDHEDHDDAVDADRRDRRDYRDVADRGGDHHHHHHRDASRGRPPTSRTSSGMPTIVSRNNVTVVNGPRSVSAAHAAEKPAKKRSRLDKFKMLFTGGSSASKENKRPSPSARAQYNSSDPESYTSSLRKRYNVFTGTDNVSTRII